MGRKKKNKPKKFTWKAWILGCGIAAVLLPFFVWLLMQLPIPSISWLEAPYWLGFWGSYLGGLLGTMVALIALYMSQKQAEEQREENAEKQRLSAPAAPPGPIIHPAEGGGAGMPRQARPGQTRQTICQTLYHPRDTAADS